ncbi:hypothetical protein VTJ04DRAFT_4421 [Mycothermus thermophilus]|uniref:uncharacterized protein n=1 Tax=Humicola insolens TaxID=85995 RepID=UPI0037436597
MPAYGVRHTYAPLAVPGYVLQRGCPEEKAGPLPPRRRCITHANHTQGTDVIPPVQTPLLESATPKTWILSLRSLAIASTSPQRLLCIEYAVSGGELSPLPPRPRRRETRSGPWKHTPPRSS